MHVEIQSLNHSFIHSAPTVYPTPATGNTELDDAIPVLKKLDLPRPTNQQWSDSAIT